MPSDTDNDEQISDKGAERLPELIRAVGDKGVEGYVRLSDLEGPAPADPTEALKQQGEVKVLPIYAEDGVTVIDHLTESTGEAVESTVEETAAD